MILMLHGNIIWGYVVGLTCSLVVRYVVLISETMCENCAITWMYVNVKWYDGVTC